MKNINLLPDGKNIGTKGEIRSNREIRRPRGRGRERGAEKGERRRELKLPLILLSLHNIFVV